MDENKNRLILADHYPEDNELLDWMGSEPYSFWQQIRQEIDRLYPGIFIPEWLYGGKKHGWSLRYKKSKSFCTLIPEKNRMGMLIVFGADEREKVEGIRSYLSAKMVEFYDQATTYHDGKWVFFPVDSTQIIQNALTLLQVKRKPKV